MITEKIITHKVLYPELWDGLNIKKDIRLKLLKIAKQFIDDSDLGIDVSDIILTGSLAGYNYTEYSDYDVHIILDFSKLDGSPKIIKELLDLKRWKWNKIHNIYINEHETELYYQDINEEHLAPGIYSLLNNKWINEPKQEDVDVDDNKIKSKAEEFMEKIDASERSVALGDEKTYEKVYTELNTVKDSIINMRKAGLDSQEGMYSIENLAFKELRNNGYLGKLLDLITTTYDKIYSVDEEQRK